MLAQNGCAARARGGAEAIILRWLDEADPTHSPVSSRIQIDPPG